MKKQDDNNNYILLDELHNVFLDHWDQENDESMLQINKSDMDKLVNKHVNYFLQLRTQALADLNESRYEKILLFLSGIKTDLAQKKMVVEKFLSEPKFAQLQPMFRNLSQLTDNDKTSIVLDAQLLNLLTELKEDVERQDVGE